MTALSPLLSNVWYRVATLKPKLRPHARLSRHRYRGQVWYVLQDPASGRTHRFTPAARLVIALMDGKHTVAELWELANRRLGEDAPTQDELIKLLGQLHATDLLQSDVTPNVAELFARSEREERARYRRSFGNPMAIRIPLWDPDDFLNRIQRLIRPIWGMWGALAWLAVVLPALVLLLVHWPELSNDFSDHLLSIDNLFVLYLVYPVLKALHELGHATATKAGGGEVHDIGIIFLVLLPVPYVEASAATTFRSKYQRAVVGAAGVTVELFVAALALYVWLLVEPGLIRAVLFNVMVIAGVSTVIFNGNPLLRYDAYYVLADLTEIPNLATRSLRYWGYLLERYLLGVRDAVPPEASPGEKAWFVFYGFASSLYRVLVTVVIALFIAQRFFIVGVLLALWAIAAMAVVPVLKGVLHLAGSPRLRRHRFRAVATTLGVAFALALFVLVIPIPNHTQAEGVVWLTEQALVRAGANGFLKEFLVEPGTRVSKGDALIRCEDPTLQAQFKVSRERIVELEATLTIEATSDRAKAQIAREKLEQEKANLALLRERISELTLRAKTDGVFIAPQHVDMLERYYRRGDLVSYVIGDETPLVRVIVPQDAVSRVREATHRVRVRLTDHPGTTLDANVVREVPAGEETLPSRALATEGGGEIVTDPRETNGPKALQRMFQFDVALSGAGQLDQFGQRAFVRFDHTPEPLSAQLYRRVRLLFLARFGV
jgi:putative peptide zinc metalloprotease protein